MVAMVAILRGCNKFRPAGLRVSLLCEVGEDVAVDVEAAEEGEEEMQEETANVKGHFFVFWEKIEKLFFKSQTNVNSVTMPLLVQLELSNL